MADQSAEKLDATAPAPVSDVAAATATDNKKADEAGLAAADEAKPEDNDTSANPDETKEDSAEKTDKDAEDAKPAADVDTEMADAPEADQSAVEGVTTTKVPTKSSSNSRRKSGGGSANRKSLSKKNSKARMTHLDAKPGDYFLVKLKGFPEWPAIICDESMLPQALLTSRPVTAARPDGTYVEAYASGGKRVNDRTFPVMYLHTNEFGWVVNTALTELTAEMATAAMEGKIRKDLKAAFELASEQHSLDHYKEILQKFEEETMAHEEAKKAATVTPKKSKKGKAKETDDDVEMADADDSTKAKKRKAEDDENVPQRPESVKKPKIKLNTSSTPKAANRASAPAKEASASKSSKQKPKKSEKKAEPKLTPEERHARKEKEVLYLRHKLQRGLLTGEATPQENDMKQMAEYITLLENFSGMEVSIIRATKINKVLKAILKLDSIPREEEFNFKARSKTLLDKWNKLMADGASAPTDAPVNGVNGSSDAHAEEKKSESTSAPTKTDKEAEAESKSEPEAATKESSAKSAEPEKADTENESEEKADDEVEKSAAAAEAVESAA